MDLTKRQNGENIKQYKIRLYRDKDILGITNSEVHELITAETGEKKAESTIRGWATAYIEGYDDAVEDGVNGADILAEIDRKKDELYIQKVKTADKLREYRKCLRDEARVENIKEVFIECAQIISKHQPLALNKPFIKSDQKVAVLSLSDLHFGEKVSNFLNTYNKNEFDNYMAKLTSDTIGYCRIMNIKSLKVLNLGDLVNGNIHVTTRVASEEDVVYQTQYVAEALAVMLTEFAKAFDSVEYLEVLDNHSRINKNKKDHIEKESFAKFIGWFLKERLKNVTNIKIIKNEIDDNIGVVDIFHEKGLFVHGHLDSPKQVIQNLSLMSRIFPIAVFYGHLHHNFEEEVHGIDLIGNPSGLGVNEYAMDIRKTSKSRQKLNIFENCNGEVRRIGNFFIDR